MYKLLVRLAWLIPWIDLVGVMLSALKQHKLGMGAWQLHLNGAGVNMCLLNRQAAGHGTPEVR